MELDLYPEKIQDAIFKNVSYYYDEEGEKAKQKQKDAGREASNSRLDNSLFDIDTAGKLQQMLGIRTNTSMMHNQAESEKPDKLNNSNYPGIFEQKDSNAKKVQGYNQRNYPSAKRASSSLLYSKNTGVQQNVNAFYNQ